MLWLKALLANVLALPSARPEAAPGFSAEVLSSFDRFAADHQKVYLSESERAFRLGIFSQSLQRIERHNASGSSYRLGVTPFADLTDEEFLQKHTLDPSVYSAAKAPAPQPNRGEARESSPRFGDLRSKQVDHSPFLPPVENQGEVGTCYAFASVGCAEFEFYRLRKQVASLSKQHLVDCGTKFSSELQGLVHGTLNASFLFLQKFGAVLEAKLPYTGDQSDCNYDIVPDVTLPEIGVVTDRVEDLLAVLEQKPVAITIQVNSELKLYQGGVYAPKYPCGFMKNHGVVAVGYDLTGTVPTIKIKNSYGTRWGDRGFLHTAVGVEGSSGTCVISDFNARYFKGDPKAKAEDL